MTAGPGLLGIGGGSIISPLLIELNVNPAVGGATASLMVVFSGSLSLLSYALGGTLNVVYGAIYGVTAFIAAAVGATVIGHIVRRTGKAGPEPVCWKSSWVESLCMASFWVARHILLPGKGAGGKHGRMHVRGEVDVPH